MSNAEENDAEDALWWEMVARRNDLNKRTRELYAAIARGLLAASGGLGARPAHEHNHADRETARRNLAEAAKAYKKAHDAYTYEVFGAAGEPEVNP